MELTRHATYHLATLLAAREPLLAAARRWWLSGKTVVLMYHELAEDGDDIEAWTVVKRSDFVRQMDYLRSKFDVVSLSQAVARMTGPDPFDRPMAVVTFDDGDRGNRDVLLPIIEDLELPVAIFVATGQVQEQRPYWFDRLINALQTNERVMVTLPAPWAKSVINETRGNNNWRRIDQAIESVKRLKPKLRELVVDDIVRSMQRHSRRSRGVAPLTVNDIRELATCPAVTIGAHSHCHNILTQLNERAVFDSVVRSKELLESWTGRHVNYFAYPNGDFNETVISAVKAAGFDAAVTSVREPWKKGQQLYALPRIGVGRYDSISTFKMMLARGYRHFLR